jgi:undecaprenyl-diphosphatase
VIVYFWKDLWAIVSDFFNQLFQGRPFASHKARLGWLLIAATLPAGIAGLLLKDIVERAFSSPLAAGIALIVTALLLFLAERISLKIGDLHDITLVDAVIMGLMQSLALFPGISRSGATISGGMMRHLNREPAARFSFLMAVPIMLAAGGLSTYEMFTEVGDLEAFLPLMAAGFITAMIVGYIAIRWLLRFLSNHHLIYFSIYCLLLGGATILTWAV